MFFLKMEIFTKESWIVQDFLLKMAFGQVQKIGKKESPLLIKLMSFTKNTKILGIVLLIIQVQL